MAEENYDPSDHTVDEVKKYVADNPTTAQAVLDAEKARGDSARSTLVSHLEELVASPPQSSEPAPVSVTPGTGDVVEKSILGETYTVDPLKGYRVKAGRESS
jgi:hypothetical protein